MNIQKFLSAILLCSLTTASIFSSTCYIFDEKSIAGEAEQELLHIFKTYELRAKNNNVAAERIEELIYSEGKQALVNEVLNKHKKTPFKNQLEAKQYLAQRKEDIALHIQKRYIEKFFEGTLHSFDPNFSLLKEQLKHAITTKYFIEAQKYLYAKGELASFLQNLDTKLKDEVKINFSVFFREIYNTYPTCR